MTEKRDIGWRLENWARWCSTLGRTGPGGSGLTSTAENCERMRKAALGEIGGAGHPRDDVSTDSKDAVCIEVGMRKLKPFDRLLLYWCYIEEARPEVICRKLSIPQKPMSEFVNRFRAAQAAIEDVVDNGNR